MLDYFLITLDYRCCHTVIATLEFTRFLYTLTRDSQAIASSAWLFGPRSLYIKLIIMSSLRRNPFFSVYLLSFSMDILIWPATTFAISLASQTFLGLACETTLPSDSLGIGIRVWTINPGYIYSLAGQPLLTQKARVAACIYRCQVSKSDNRDSW